MSTKLAQVVEKIITESPNPTLMEGFMLVAIRVYANQVISGPDIYSTPAWKALALDVERGIEAKYGDKKI